MVGPSLLLAVPERGSVEFDVDVAAGSPYGGFGTVVELEADGRDGSGMDG